MVQNIYLKVKTYMPVSLMQTLAIRVYKVLTLGVAFNLKLLCHTSVGCAGIHIDKYTYCRSGSFHVKKNSNVMLYELKSCKKFSTMKFSCSVPSVRLQVSNRN